MADKLRRYAATLARAIHRWLALVCYNAGYSVSAAPGDRSAAPDRSSEARMPRTCGAVYITVTPLGGRLRRTCTERLVEIDTAHGRWLVCPACDAVLTRNEGGQVKPPPAS